MAIFRDTKCSRSIPVTLIVKRGRETEDIFDQMKSFIQKYYMEPENISLNLAGDEKGSDKEINHFDFSLASLGLREL